MTPKAPAVSQLAGKIAEGLFPNPFSRPTPEFHHMEREQRRALAIISAALSEREEKVKELCGASQQALDELFRLLDILDQQDCTIVAVTRDRLIRALADMD